MIYKIETEKKYYVSLLLSHPVHISIQISLNIIKCSISVATFCFSHLSQLTKIIKSQNFSLQNSLEKNPKNNRQWFLSYLEWTIRLMVQYFRMISRIKYSAKVSFKGPLTLCRPKENLFSLFQFSFLEVPSDVLYSSHKN